MSKKKTAIAKLHVNCSFPMKPNAIAASDTCQRPAVSGVVAPNGHLYWRCPRHEGLYDAATKGQIRYQVELPYEEAN